MGKTIRLEEEVYTSLEAFRDKKETYSQAVERLLELPGRINELSNIMEGQKEYKESKLAKLKEQSTNFR